MRTGIAFFFMSCILVSCNDKNKLPSGILKPEKMQAVLWDIMRADAFTTNFIKKDSSKNDAEENIKLQKKVFALHQVSSENFYKSYDYYKTNTNLFKSILDSMITNANRTRNLKAIQ